MFCEFFSVTGFFDSSVWKESIAGHDFIQCDIACFDSCGSFFQKFHIISVDTTSKTVFCIVCKSDGFFDVFCFHNRSDRTKYFFAPDDHIFRHIRENRRFENIALFPDFSTESNFCSFSYGVRYEVCHIILCSFFREWSDICRWIERISDFKCRDLFCIFLYENIVKMLKNDESFRAVTFLSSIRKSCFYCFRSDEIHIAMIEYDEWITSAKFKNRRFEILS